MMRSLNRLTVTRLLTVHRERETTRTLPPPLTDTILEQLVGGSRHDPGAEKEGILAAVLRTGNASAAAPLPGQASSGGVEAARDGQASAGEGGRADAGATPAGRGGEATPKVDLSPASGRVSYPCEHTL